MTATYPSREVAPEFWTWAVEAYARAGVEVACLDLQDQHGQCIPLLLWSAWTDTAEGQALGRAVALCRQWQDEVTGPLRSARRALRPAHHLIEDAARERLRARVKGAELEAERLLIDSLQAMTPQRPPAARLPILERLRQTTEAFGGSAAPDALLADLAGRLGAAAVESSAVLL